MAGKVRDNRELLALPEHPSWVAAAVSDVELGVLARGGDVQALAALLEQCRPALYATAVRLLGNRHDALDAFQDTCVVALARVGELRDAGAVRGWLHAVIRNVCLMRLRQRREMPSTGLKIDDTVPGPEHVFEQHAMRDWIWRALELLSSDERTTVMLRYFARSTSYQAIAQVTAVPVGTVRSRLHRARARMADALLSTIAETDWDHIRLKDTRRLAWEEFYGAVHERPEPHTYRDLFAPDVQVRDTIGQWHGIQEWSAEERQAISIGVRAVIVDVLAAGDVTILEIDFRNPTDRPDHCPPQATFVHRLDHGRSARLQIHYPRPTHDTDLSFQ